MDKNPNPSAFNPISSRTALAALALLACACGVETPETDLAPTVSGPEQGMTPNDSATMSSTHADDPAAGGTFSPSSPSDQVTCPDGQFMCASACIDLRRNVDHCGACGNSCGDNSCRDGLCGVGGTAFRLPGEYDSNTYDIAVAPDGDVILVGTFQGELHGGTLPAQGDDAFVARVSAEGKVLWLQQLAGHGAQVAYSVAVNHDTVVVGGAFDGSLRVGDTKLVSRGNEDAFVVAFSADGQPLWLHSLSDAIGPEGTHAEEVQRTTAVALTKSGDVVATGRYTGDLAISGMPNEREGRVLQGSGGLDGFVLRLTRMGAFSWAATVGGADDQQIDDVVTYGEEAILVGTFRHELSHNGSWVLDGSTNDDVFALRLDENGQPVWTRRFGDAGDERAKAAAIGTDAQQLLVLGRSATDFVMKLGLDGQVRGGTALPSSDAHLAAISAGVGGDVWLAGTLDGTLELTSGSMASRGADALVLRFDANLQPSWAHRYGTEAPENAAAIVCDGGVPYVAGDFADTIGVDGAGVASTGGINAFLLSLTP